MEEYVEILEMDLDNIVDCLCKQVSFEYAQIIGTAIKKVLTKQKELEKESRKYIVKLTDKQYKRVIEIAQKDCISKTKIEEKINKLTCEYYQKREKIKKIEELNALKSEYEKACIALQEVLEDR